MAQCLNLWIPGGTRVSNKCNLLLQKTWAVDVYSSFICNNRTLGTTQMHFRECPGCRAALSTTTNAPQPPEDGLSCGHTWVTLQGLGLNEKPSPRLTCCVVRVCHLEVTKVIRWRTVARGSEGLGEKQASGVPGGLGCCVWTMSVSASCWRLAAVLEMLPLGKAG